MKMLRIFIGLGLSLRFARETKKGLHKISE